MLLFKRVSVSLIAEQVRHNLMNIRGYLELLQDQVLEPTPETLADQSVLFSLKKNRTEPQLAQ